MQFNRRCNGMPGTWLFIYITGMSQDGNPEDDENSVHRMA
jgi:hypothetical protein